VDIGFETAFGPRAGLEKCSSEPGANYDGRNNSVAHPGREADCSPDVKSKRSASLATAERWTAELGRISESQPE
jgi:hypothetical protein